jgi:hypothetical protein
MKTALSFLILAATATCGTARAEGARVDLTASAGAFRPTENNLDENVPGLGSVTAKFGTANMFGGRLDIWFNEHVGVEGTAYHAGGSSLEGQAFGAPGAVDASLTYGTGRLAVGVGETTRLILSAGLGIQSASYDTPDIEDGTLTVGVLGAGVLLPLGSAVSLRVDLDDYIYNMYWEIDGLRSEERLQQDVVLAAGLTFHIGR